MFCYQATVYPAGDFAIFGVFSFLAGLAALKLPETRKQPMYETVEDLLQGQRNRSNQVAVQAISEDKVKLLQEEIEGNNASEEE